MLDQVDRLLAVNGFLPHGYCISWSPGLVSTFVISDLLIVLSYFSMPAALGYFARKRTDFPYRWLLWMFAGFIMACGTTHLIDVIVLWQPVYRLDALVKAITALVSVVTAIAIWYMIPKALRLPSPNQLRALNEKLQDEIEERIQAQAALQEAKEAAEAGWVRERTLLAAIVEFSDDAIVGQRLDGIVTSWNRAAERMYGYSAAEVVGQHSDLVIPLDRREEKAAIIARIRRGESVRHFETVRLHKDGHAVDVSVTLSPIRDVHGEIVGASTVARDITQRREAEEALRASEARFASLVKLSSDVYWETDAEHRLSKFEFEGDYDPVMLDSTSMGKRRWELPYTYPNAAGWAQLQATLEARRSFTEFEVARTLPDGTIRWSEIAGEPVYDQSGQFVGYRGLAREITARKQVEEGLRTLSRAVEQAPVSIVITDRDAGIEYVNPYFEIATGYSRAEAIGQNPRILQSGVTSPETYEQLWRTVTAGREWRGEFCNKKKNGEFYWEQVCISGLSNERGEVTHYVAVKEDITERKRIARELESSHRLLESRVAQRTAELAASNEELSAFSYSVSHDLRAPLRAIEGFSAMLEEEHGQALSPTAKSLLARVRNGVRRMDLLIEALLGLARLNRQELQLQRFDLATVVEQVASELASGDPHRQVEFRIARDVIILADVALLRVVMQNLLGNAWKYTANHSPAVIEFGVQAGVTADREFFVRDNGVGFDMAYAHKLFTPFQRLHTDVQYQGTGIGLATVRRIITRHGGRVWANGEPEQGASFYFTVPESRDGVISA